MGLRSNPVLELLKGGKKGGQKKESRGVGGHMVRTKAMGGGPGVWGGFSERSKNDAEGGG